VARLETSLVLHERLDEHPATRAWRQLRPHGIPSEIRVLKQRSKGMKTRGIYWLAEAGPGGRAVLAKLSLRAAVEVEALIYGEFLRHLGVGTPAFHGTVDDEGPLPLSWLFMDYLSGDRYSSTSPSHRRLVGEWIAGLHEEAASVSRVARLPDRGMRHHLATLRRTRNAVVAHAGDPSLSRSEASGLRRLGAALSEIERGWDDVEAVCSEVPPTLVHGDLKRRNLRVGVLAGVPAVAVFDWETAGWGPPAVDLARSACSRPERRLNVCLDTYRSARSPGLTLTREEVERQAAAGTILRCLTAISWRALSLGPLWHDCDDHVRKQVLGGRAETLALLEFYRVWLELNGRLDGWVRA
jgi:aminoglycoside phosphotransferase (APT) family kinase protein